MKTLSILIVTLFFGMYFSKAAQAYLHVSSSPIDTISEFNQIAGMLVKEPNKFDQNFINSVVTNEDTLVCNHIDVNLLNTEIVFANGESKSLRNKEIMKVYQRGQIFERKPAYINNETTGQNVMMELVKDRFNLRIYKYVRYDLNVNRIVDDYLIFRKDGQYMLRITPDNKDHLISFFGLNPQIEITERD